MLLQNVETIIVPLSLGGGDCRCISEDVKGESNGHQKQRPWTV